MKDGETVGYSPRLFSKVFLFCCLANRKELSRQEYKIKNGIGLEAPCVVTIIATEHILTDGRVNYQRLA